MMKMTFTKFFYALRESGSVSFATLRVTGARLSASIRYSPSRHVYIGNLPATWADRDVSEMIKSLVEVEFRRIIVRQKILGGSKHCFVWMWNIHDARMCINKLKLLNQRKSPFFQPHRVLKVGFAQEEMQLNASCETLATDDVSSVSSGSNCSFHDNSLASLMDFQLMPPIEFLGQPPPAAMQNAFFFQPPNQSNGREVTMSLEQYHAQAQEKEVVLEQHFQQLHFQQQNFQQQHFQQQQQ